MAPSHGLLAGLRRILAPLSPRRRRWRRFLAALPLTPESAVAAGPPGANDVLICGCPRSGTTLLAAQLFQPPAVVTVMEPWDGLRLPPAELFPSLRRELAAGTLSRGKLDVDALRREGKVRWRAEGEPVAVTVSPDPVVAVKWPAYWQLLGGLPGGRFLVCLRHPFEVVASFRHQGGRLASGLEYDVAFNRSFNTALSDDAHDPVSRRALFWERVNRAVLAHLDRPDVMAVRYERWFDDPDGLRRDLEGFLDVELGPWPANIRPARHHVDDDAGTSREEREAVRRLCPTAEALGYDLGEDRTGSER